MQFQQLTLEQIEPIRKYLPMFSGNTCDYTVGGMFMWRFYYNMEYAVIGDAIFTRLTDKSGRIYYNLPLASDINEALKLLKTEIQRSDSKQLRFCTIPKEYIEMTASLLKDPTVSEQTNLSDYLYATEDMVTLKGRKFSGQRNHINNFERSVENWSFSPMDSKNIGSVIDFYHAQTLASEFTSEFAEEENRMVGEVLENMDAYKMVGGVLAANDRVIGFSLGEIINRTMYTHVERAERGFKGAYQMLSNQFARMFADGVTDYINREEDMGDLGLRTAKQALHPAQLLKKYVVEGEIK